MFFFGLIKKTNENCELRSCELMCYIDVGYNSIAKYCFCIPMSFAIRYIS